MKQKIIYAIAAILVLFAVWYWFVGSEYEVGNIDPETLITAEDKATNAGIIGVWQSKADPNFTREFLADTTVIDRYAGDEGATTRSTWSTFTAKDPDPGVTMYLDESAYYLAIRDENSEPYYFAITSMTPDVLTLLYMNQGGVQEYIRVK